MILETTKGRDKVRTSSMESVSEKIYSPSFIFVGQNVWYAREICEEKRESDKKRSLFLSFFKESYRNNGPKSTEESNLFAASEAFSRFNETR